MGFVDTHAHLLPFWDDGADSWDTALGMLRMAEEDGIEAAVCTPHILSPKDLEHESALWARYDDLVLRADAAGLKIRIHMGCELFAHPGLDLSRKMATPAQNGRYFLVEFPMGSMPDFVLKGFFSQFAKEYTPIIAHPERYARIIQNPQEASILVEKGAFLQVNAGSVLGVFGGTVKETAFRLLDANLVHLIASDAHDLKARPLRLRAAFSVIEEKYGQEIAKRLFEDNPARVLRAADLIADPARPIEEPPKRKLWQRFELLKNRQ
jgi:protein-tyrosine phosphatase